MARLEAKVTKTSSGGSFYHADCPYCGKSKLLGSEMLIMWAVCKICRKPFNLFFEQLPLIERALPEPTGPRFEDEKNTHGPDSWPVKYGSK